MTPFNQPQPSTAPKDAFVTYAWDKDNPDHQLYVEGFVNLLRDHGIYADMDLRQSQLETAIDFTRMMHQGITDYKKVIIFMSEAYQRKATAFEDGVGKEYQLIIKDIDKNPNKYILVSTNGRTDNVVPPAFREREIVSLSDPIKKSQFDIIKAKIFGLQTRQFVDVAETIEKIAVAKPNVLLMIDDIITDGNTAPAVATPLMSLSKTSRLLQQIDATLENRPTAINLLLKEFCNAFIEQLSVHKVNYGGTSTDDEICEKIYNNITSFTPTRNEFILFLDKLSRSGHTYDTTPIISLFERIPPLYDPTTQTENYKFIVHELFILTISLLIKNENYDHTAELFYSFYHIRESHNSKKVTFEEFRHHTYTLEHYVNKITGKNLISGQANLIIERCPDELTRFELVQADLLCYFVSKLKAPSKYIDWWYPILFIYKDNHYAEFYNRLQSKKHFEKVQPLFDVKSPNELSDRLLEMQRLDIDKPFHYSQSFETIPALSTLINPLSISTER